MNLRIQYKQILLMALLLASLYGLAGCQEQARSARVSADWSRGERVGQAVLNDRVALALDPAADGLWMAWVMRRSGATDDHLHLARLDGSGQLLWERSLALATQHPSQVEIHGNVGGPLHLTWLDVSAAGNTLWHVCLAGDGALACRPQTLSLPGANVHSYAAAINAAGDLEIVWGAAEGATSGLYHMRLDARGQALLANARLTGSGFDPALAIARDGTIHLAWQDEPTPGEGTLHYAILGESLQGMHRLASYPVPTGVKAHRPAVGLAGNKVYIFWSIERRGGGLTPPRADSYYLSFVVGEAQLAGRPQPVLLSSPAHPIYEVRPSRFQGRHLATVDPGALPSDFVYLPSIAPGHWEELAVAFAVEIATRTKKLTQIVLTLWGEEGLQGYQIIGQTGSSSMNPKLLADAAGDLYVSWIDAAGPWNYDVYFASTAAKVRARLNRVTARDVLEGVLRVAVGIGQAMSFLPLALMWMMAPLILLAIYAFFRPETQLTRLGPRLMLAIGIVIYTFFKYLLRANWLLLLPLPRSLPIPLANLIIYLAPVGIAALASILTWRWGRRRESVSLFAAFFVFAAIDASLTLLIYIPSFLAE